METKHFGHRLTEARKRAKLTREQLAVAAGIHSNTIAAMERSKKAIGRVATLSAIASALNLDLSELAG